MHTPTTFPCAFDLSFCFILCFWLWLFPFLVLLIMFVPFSYAHPLLCLWSCLLSSFVHTPPLCSWSYLLHFLMHTSTPPPPPPSKFLIMFIAFSCVLDHVSPPPPKKIIYFSWVNGVFKVLVCFGVMNFGFLLSHCPCPSWFLAFWCNL